MAVVSDAPILTEMVDKSRRITRVWLDYFVGPAPGSAFALAQGIQAAVTLPVAPTRLTGQVATIPSTPFPLGTNPGGLFRLSFYARITTPGSVSSSLTVSFSWTDGAVACSVSSAAMTGNTTGSTLSGSTLIQSDASSPIDFSALYASVGTPMAFSLAVMLETVPVTLG